MQDGCVRAKKDRVRLHICWRTAASEHGRSYAITSHLTTNVSATQGRVVKLVALVSLVHLVSLVYPVSLVQLNTQDKLKKPVASPVSRDTFHVSRFTGLLSQAFAAVGGGEILVGAKRDDTGRIDVVVGDVVMPLDVVEVHGVGDAVGLIEVFEVAEEVRVVYDSPEVALKMAVVDGVEAHEGD